ncbi:lactonase family protein [Christiangramia aestuarii]|uniref:Lactonase family protein n=1 Tax=Christiangramia aestuarii TaxID=1028746 RepID=A0A7K1LQ01_9FLAO|nr:lactonase family protein [Christiangramia aestuarii]MUP42889.1 lactonase family protein [Christiangramia aestuarii]
MKRNLVILVFGILFSLPSHSQMNAGIQTDSINKIYVGTYTRKEGHVDGKAKGIYLINQNPSTGELKFVGTAAEMTNPSFVKVGKMGKYLFAVSELGPGDGESGFIHSFEILKDGALRNISKLGTGGYAPCHIALDRSGKFAFVSNYMGGVVMVYKINTDGSLEKNQEIKLENPDAAHAHSVKVSGDNRYAYIADLGNDKIWVYDFDRMEGKLQPHRQGAVELKKGAGPRHMSLAKNGSFAYSINELNSSLSVFAIKEHGGLEHIQDISSLPQSYRNKNSAADIHIHPGGNFLYASNRGHNSIAAFKIDAETGKLSTIDHFPIAGETPRNFAISPFGRYLYAASQDTGNITTYKIDPNTGKLKVQPRVFEIKTPVCLEFVK